MAWEENSCISLNMQLIAILSRIGVISILKTGLMQDLSKQNSDKNPFFPVRICVLPQVASWGKGMVATY